VTVTHIVGVQHTHSERLWFYFADTNTNFWDGV